MSAAIEARLEALRADEKELERESQTIHDKIRQLIEEKGLVDQRRNDVRRAVRRTELHLEWEMSGRSEEVMEKAVSLALGNYSRYMIDKKKDGKWLQLKRTLYPSSAPGEPCLRGPAAKKRKHAQCRVDMETGDVHKGMKVIASVFRDDPHTMLGPVIVREGDMRFT
jgi:hypothetical protein